MFSNILDCAASIKMDVIGWGQFGTFGHAIEEEQQQGSLLAARDIAERRLKRFSFRATAARRHLHIDQQRPGASFA